MLSLVKKLIVLVSIFSATPTLAEQAGAENSYRQGVEFLRGEKFSLALESFNNAEKNGLKSTSLYYNRGVALYKLGQYPEAKQAFLLALDNADDTALVYYNIGLVEARLGNTSAAMMAFSNAAASTTNKKLARLSNEMISRLDNEAKAHASSSKGVPFVLMADGMLGFDDNVTLENTEIAQGSSLKDMYYDLYASMKYQFLGDRKNGYWMRAGASTIQYQDYKQYNFTQYSASLFRDREYGDIDVRMGAKYARIYVGGVDYLDKLTARIQAGYALSKQQKLRARYELAVYDELDVKYSHLSGTRSKIKLDSTWRLNGKRTRLGYELETNDRSDFTVGNNFTSYSATRHKVYADVILKINKSWKTKLAVDFRQSRYNDVNLVAGMAIPARKDDRFRLSATAEYYLNRDVDLVVEYHYSDNDSNIITRRYQRNRLLLGVHSYF